MRAPEVLFLQEPGRERLPWDECEEVPGPEGNIWQSTSASSEAHQERLQDGLGAQDPTGINECLNPLGRILRDVSKA